MARIEECLTCKGEKVIYARGLCRRCYVAALYAVRAGKTCWREITELGLAAETNHCPVSVFSERLAEARSKGEPHEAA